MVQSSGTVVATAVLAIATLVGCADSGPSASSAPADGRGPSATASARTPPGSGELPGGGLDSTPTAEAEPAFVPSDGAPRAASLTIPTLGIRDLRVEPYEGWTDDGPGTAIQDGGIAASPYGARGGVGPGGIGNYQVTAHRTSSTRAFEFLPDLAPGDLVVVRSGGTRYVYEIRSTRRTSFRSERSLAEQRAAVPGQPGAEPDQAFITLSTCATPEDRAAGNFWSDRFGNFEHRIDKIGVLVSTHPVGEG